MQQERQHTALPRRAQAGIVLGMILVVAVAGAASHFGPGLAPTSAKAETPSRSAEASGSFRPGAVQWASLSFAMVEPRIFRAQHVTEGKIAVDEDRSTPIFSPYSGRITRLLAMPGDSIARGQTLFVIEASDAVQAQNDFITAVAATSKARSQVTLSDINEKRQRDLYEGKAVALKDWQQAQADLVAAQSDLRSAEISLEAARNRMRMLGRGDEEMKALEQKGAISADTPIHSPIAGTIVQRKVGPGQYVSAGSSDPVYVVGDLSTVWLVAYVRETEAPKVSIGQAVNFTVLAHPGRVFGGNITYVSTAIDPNTRRLLVRASVDNHDGGLKPEMFANVNIITGEGDRWPAVSRDAVIYEGDNARVWIARDDRTLELREIKLGLLDGGMIQVLDGLRIGERVVTKGSLFIDRAAASNG